MTIKNSIRAVQLPDELLKNCKKPGNILGESGPPRPLARAIMERALPADLAHHLAKP